MVVAEVLVMLELVERSGKLFLGSVLVLMGLLLALEDWSYCMYRDFYDLCLSP